MINNIYCIGRNYSEHAKELGNQVEEQPIVFSKPNTSLVEGQLLQLPKFSSDVHYETEVVIKISRAGFEISEDLAEDYYDSVAVGLDLTARDLQAELKNKQLPWLLAKGFKGACYVSDFFPKQQLPENIHFGLKINDNQVQSGNTGDMLFGMAKIISFISQYIALQPGDIIFTGTPKGVGKLQAGDRLTLLLEGKVLTELRVS